MKDDEQICPDCAEVIKKAAKVCRHCGYRFLPLDSCSPAELAPPEGAISQSDAVDGLSNERQVESDEATRLVRESNLSRPDEAVPTGSWPERTFGVKPANFWIGCGLIVAIPFVLEWAFLNSSTPANSNSGNRNRIEATSETLSDQTEKEAEAALAAADEALAEASGAMSGETLPHQRNVEKPDEIEIVTLCDLTLKEALMSPSSMDGSYKWNYIFDGKNTATVRRKFDHQNGFGAQIRSEYLCEVDTDTSEINKLTVNGPMGSTKVL